MNWIISLYVLQALGFVILIAAGWLYFDKRYNKKSTQEHRSELLKGALDRTAEVFIDPRDDTKYRVYYNRITGEREYVAEEKDK